MNRLLIPVVVAASYGLAIAAGPAPLNTARIEQLVGAKDDDGCDVEVSLDVTALDDKGEPASIAGEDRGANHADAILPLTGLAELAAQENDLAGARALYERARVIAAPRSEVRPS